MAVATHLAQHLTADLPGWVALFRELIRLPSPYEEEHPILAHVEERIAALGLKAVRVPFESERLSRLPGHQLPISTKAGRHNLVVRLQGQGGGRSLVLGSHLDVAPVGDTAAWTHPPYSAHIDPETNVIYGRGAMDDKAGVVICLALLELLVRAPFRLAGDVVLHFVLEDETTGNGSLLCLDAGHGGDAAILLDGTRGDRGINAHAGNLRFGLSLQGKPASVSVSHMGLNAVEILARMLLHMKAAIHDLNVNRQPPWTMFPSPYQFIVHALHGEGESLTVPEHAHTTCHVTFPPPDDLVSMRRRLEALASGFAQAEGLPYPPCFQWAGHFATEPVMSDSAALESTMLASAQRLGWPPIAFGPSTGTSDMRHFHAAGIPTVLYGPGRGYNPHRPDEHYFLDDLPRMLAFFLDLTVSWCGEADS